MPALQVKDFPEDLYEDLKKYAAEDCRSVSQQTLYILREYVCFRKTHGLVRSALWAEPLVSDLGTARELAERAARVEKRRRIRERIEARGPIEAPEDFPDAAELIRQGREERTDRILEAVGDLEKIRDTEAKHDCA